ncbi:mechanosensitive ion channel family protein [Rubrivirga sp. S365]|uniref:mechanosensitive ion channel family protein n=1 Tax=Rubrivirga sp. S365 TaxID=3076080 RepID=UPI0028C7F25E|nr:mechanosensitive ion channel family protein [Rubrivirga sp. S365]MDT7857548.1 mechanosensitive ion channel family protein [Rubrivirga sp. S365]
MQLNPLRPDSPEVAVQDSVKQAAKTAAEVIVGLRDRLTSEAFWLNIGWTVIQVVVVITAALFLLGLFERIKRRWVKRAQMAPTLDKRRQRVLTVADLLGSVARYAVWTVTGITVLSMVGFDIRALLAGAGIAGLAIGFGAQTFVKDVISGFFLLFDDTLGNGDLIRIGDDVGTVEYVGLRLIKVRKFSGELLMVPAGEVRTFGNQSVGFARVVVTVALSYEQDAHEALRVLEAVAEEWAATDAAKDAMVDDAPEVQGLLSLDDSGVTARIIVQVRPGEQFAADRAIRTLVKQRLAEAGVEIPFPRRTVYVRSSGGAAASPEDAAAAGAD